MKKNVLDTDLTGKVAVVTGAGGVLCSAFAKDLARAGAKVALLDRNYENASRYAAEIVEEGGVVSGGTNTATSGDKKGANVYMDSSAKISRCHLIGGVHTAYNGGSLCVYSSSVRVEDCLVEGSECGGVLLGGTSYLYNCTVVDNEPYGVWAWSATQHIFNTIVFGNISS